MFTCIYLRKFIIIGGGIVLIRLFLLCQVLATDELWPAQGGKALDISQVKEAIDAILSSQRDRTSSSE